MKKNRTSSLFRLIAVALLLVLTVGTMTSCAFSWNWAGGIIPNASDGKKNPSTASGTDTFADVNGFAVDAEGHLILHLGDGTELELNISGDAGIRGVIPSDVYNTEIKVDTSGTTDLSYAASKALLSSVSVWCSYERRVAVDPFSSWFFGYGSNQQSTEEYHTAGSGVIFKLDKQKGDAYIITNFHVVYDSQSTAEDGISQKITVNLFGSEADDMSIPAEFIGGSLYYDIAVLKVSGSTLLQHSAAEAVTFGNSDAVTAGQVAMAVGNPEAGGISVTSGIVSVPSEYINMTGADNRTAVSFRVIRVDTAVNSGNSGGGLFNAAGDLIGIVNAKVSDSSVENIGYAIPTSVVRAIAENILYYCDGKDCKRVQRGMLGISVQRSGSHAVVDPETGLVSIEEMISVAEVTEGGLADGVLMVGDVICAVTIGEKTVQVTRQYHVIDTMLDARVGSTVVFSILRGGESMDVSFTLDEDSLTAY